MYQIQFRHRIKKRWRPHSMYPTLEQAIKIVDRRTRLGYWAPRYGRVVHDGATVYKVDSGTPLDKLNNGELLWRGKS